MLLALQLATHVKVLGACANINIRANTIQVHVYVQVHAGGDRICCFQCKNRMSGHTHWEGGGVFVLCLVMNWAERVSRALLCAAANFRCFVYLSSYCQRFLRRAMECVASNVSFLLAAWTLVLPHPPATGKHAPRTGAPNWTKCHPAFLGLRLLF